MQSLTVQVILEILGRPKEHLATSLNALVDKLGTEKGIKIIEKKINDPVEVKDSKDLFTSFADLILEFESIQKYFGFLFAYMPAHVEIISPDEVNLKNTELTHTTNLLMQRLHNYDSIAKKMIADRAIILNKLKEKAPELFRKSEDGQTASNTTYSISENKENKKSKKKSKKKK